MCGYCIKLYYVGVDSIDIAKRKKSSKREKEGYGRFQSH